MSEKLTATCPYCKASFQVTQVQLAQARGRVRCGNCLAIFDGVRSDFEFIPPELPKASVRRPLLDLEVGAMTSAELPVPERHTNWNAWMILVALILLLLGQLYLPEIRHPTPSLELARLVVRPHPERDQALRLDAIIRNRGESAAQLPLLLLGFTNARGEPRAQRAFHPGEYLHGTELLLLPPQSEIQVSLSLADPGGDAVSYLARLEPVTSRSN